MNHTTTPQSLCITSHTQSVHFLALAALFSDVRAHLQLDIELCNDTATITPCMPVSTPVQAHSLGPLLLQVQRRQF